MTKKKRTPAEVWRAIEEGAANDEMERILAMSDEEIAGELRAEGFDPVEIGRGGEELAARLAAERRRAEWQAEAARRLADARRVLTPRRGGARRPRKQLLDRIEALRHDPRLSGPVAVAFRKRTADESSNEELEAMLAALEDLAKLGDALK